MPSSTSNSKPARTKGVGWADQRIPEGPWLKTLALAGAIFLLGILSFEALGRAKGFTPSLRDSASLWNLSREQANQAGEQALVLAGSSRSQLGIDLDVLAEELPGRVPIQLGVNGSSSLA